METTTQTGGSRLRSTVGRVMAVVLITFALFAAVAPTAEARQLSEDQKDQADACRDIEGGVPAIGTDGTIYCFIGGTIRKCVTEGPLTICDEEVVLASESGRPSGADVTGGDIGTAVDHSGGTIGGAIASAPATVGAADIAG